MTEERSIVPMTPVRTIFLPSGEEIAEYTGSEYGNQPEWSKSALIGAGLIIRGQSDNTFHEDGSSFPPARSILYNVVEAYFGDDVYSDGPEVEPWGMFFTDKTENPADWGTNREHRDTSTLLKQVRTELKKNGGRAFLTSMDWVETVPATKNAGPQGYYRLRKWVRQTNPKASTQNQTT